MGQLISTSAIPFNESTKIDQAKEYPLNSKRANDAIWSSKIFFLNMLVLALRQQKIDIVLYISDGVRAMLCSETETKILDRFSH